MEHPVEQCNCYNPTKPNLNLIELNFRGGSMEEGLPDLLGLLNLPYLHSVCGLLGLPCLFSLWGLLSFLGLLCSINLIGLVNIHLNR